MKKKVLTMVMVVAGIVSIGGIGFALSANQVTNKTSSNNDIMYAQVKTPETSLATAEDTSLVTVEDMLKEIIIQIILIRPKIGT